MIYLDYQATTPLAPEARAAMLPWLAGPEAPGFANPHSPHRYGRAAAAAVEAARAQVAALLPPGGRVIITSGATEAINLAIVGSGCTRLAASAIEHAAVLDTARFVDPGVAVLPVDGEGLVDPDAAIPEGTGLVAVMQVNNEIGTVQPIVELARRAREAGALFLCDAVQGAGKLEAPEGADMIAISAHKLYGPKGIGALWVRDGIELQPLIHGGGQEGGLRSGTLSPALCAGFGAAAALCTSLREKDAHHVEKLWTRARSLFDGWLLNGSATRRWHGNLNLRLPGLDVSRLLSECRTVAFSAGSACASGSGRPSHVLRALGLSDRDGKNAIRLGFGRYTTEEELEQAAAAILAAARSQGVW
ncbi:aminotransferase, class V [Novosphingobium aromaticivorans DSM 12444]|uniref:Cysteine desulfurase n=1 Tax=Novosphingobium aromaticivorans (strain ATCC 700278 / DSM 12444 / CCUG 56034 / CIP 105152 / NBRC 16084 / F199) TaxID=279238 RepID=Q2G4J0_NOVAD|nr:cysteine desulfurase family protein [Novosphingobium aromaticivorans]ABD27233.1 aminotransferase, class V [Novosphingobium aromaticivorans DSM 12444]SCY93830.1 cysteine desulfurase [Novosphingobium aromaticivorans]